jgi:hypothetical protein
VPSMGSIGNCYDSAVIGSFWSRMQVELLDRHRWRTRLELANAIFEYLEIPQQTASALRTGLAHASGDRDETTDHRGLDSGTRLHETRLTPVPATSVGIARS